MKRRDLLRAFGATTALAMLPSDALAAWTRVGSGVPLAQGLTEAQLALVGAIADTIIPRTDTPGATDVGVPVFVNVIVSENYGDDERAAFVAGLEAIDARAKTDGGASFAELAPDARGAVVGAIESLERRSEPARTYWRLKGLVVHGYFTSEQVSTQVLKAQITHAKFDGAAPMPVRAATPPSDRSDAHA
jgi:hypothetical protein